MVETINKLLRTQRRLTQELNREPTNEEIAKAMEIDVEKVEHIMKIKQDISARLTRPFVTTKKIQFWLTLSKTKTRLALKNQPPTSC